MANRENPFDSKDLLFLNWLASPYLLTDSIRLACGSTVTLVKVNGGLFVRNMVSPTYVGRHQDYIRPDEATEVMLVTYAYCANPPCHQAEGQC